MNRKTRLNESIRVTDVPVADLLTFMSSDGKFGRRARSLEQERVIRELGVELIIGDDKIMHARIEQSLLDFLLAHRKLPKLKCIALCYLTHAKANLSEGVRGAVQTFITEERNGEIVYEARKMV